MANLNSYAQQYLDMGFFPIPVYGIREDSACSCGNLHCAKPGKHPIGDAWQKNAPKTQDAVRDTFARHDGNIGVCLQGTPFVLLDFDGPVGLATLQGLIDEGLIAPTLRANTGSGGVHLFYRFADHHDRTAVTDRSRVLPGFDVKRSGQAVVYPSRHASGGSYTWDEDGWMSPATLPDELYQRIRRPVRIVAPAPASVAYSGSDRVKRAAAYVAKMEPAIMFADGSGKLWNVARKLIKDFGLSRGEAESIILREYNPRCQPPWSKAEIDHKLDDAEKAHTANPVPDRPRSFPPGPQETYDSPPNSAPAPEGPWMDSKIRYKHTRTGKRVMMSNVYNTIRVLRYHPEWEGHIRFDSFRTRLEIVNPPWHDAEKPTEGEPNWCDEDTTRTVSWLQNRFHEEDFSPSCADVERAVSVVAHANAYHPVREYLDALRWDGVSRLAGMAETYFGAEGTLFNRKVFEWWMISAVARVYQPGCKADYVLILEGDTGIMKSTALGALAGEWFSDTEIDLNSKDAYQQIKGKWIVELGELHSLVKSSDSRAKAFFSSRSDDYRASYARHSTENPRQCVFAGTTNETEYLVDRTGNRRFWPVACAKADAAGIRRDRDQLWAEARDLYRAGAEWWPSGEALEGAVEAQEERTAKDTWLVLIADYVARHALQEVSLGQIMTAALDLEPKDQTPAAQKRAAVIMLHKLQWKKKKVRRAGILSWVYVRMEQTIRNEPERL